MGPPLWVSFPYYSQCWDHSKRKGGSFELLIDVFQRFDSSSWTLLSGCQMDGSWESWFPLTNAHHFCSGTLSCDSELEKWPPRSQRPEPQKVSRGCRSRLPSLKLTNSEFAPENGWLEYDCFLLGWSIFRGELLGFWEGMDPKFCNINWCLEDQQKEPTDA